ncbi:sigma-70 family RNA polymerase sigma factor [Pseudonocardia yuanmonensis]|uniref:Sigma-70 family RNA polymerase sigma factor n=1 Tax=Pseudonocardia yuanmonensis TaxID=1095914 RepID=A0ABP8WAS0_9PSEU
MPVADPELVERLREGDEQAFAEVVRTWSPSMLRLARVHVRTHASAEEVVQEAWLAVVRGLDGFAARSSLRTWVFTILVNTARRRGRAEAGQVVELARPSVDPDRFRGEDDEYPGHWRPEAAPVEWGPEPEVLAAEFRGLLDRALAELPHRQRAVVELRDVHGLDAEEVCALLDLTPANQRVLLHRARSRLRGLLEEAIA